MQSARHIRGRGIVRCRRKQYQGVRMAAQFLMPLLTNSQLLTPSSTCSYQRREKILDALMGVPSSLGHEGPLNYTHLTAFMSLQMGELLDMLEGPYMEAVAPPPSTHVAEMWSSSLQECYIHAVLHERSVESASEEKKTRPLRYEAGLVAQNLFADTLYGINTNKNFLSSGGGTGETTRRKETCESRLTSCKTLHLTHRWRQLIDEYTLMLPDRSPLHELENLPQEVGIGELLSSLFTSFDEGESEIKTIVDVGGGNGFLAAQLADRLKCESIVVDPFTPKHSIDNEDFPHWVNSPRQRPRTFRRYPLRRIPLRLPEVDWNSTNVNFDRCALVAKHLCGTAIDECLRHLQDLGKLPRVVVVVPCCYNKGCYDQYCNVKYLSNTANISNTDMWNRWTPLSDWNYSCNQCNINYNSSTLSCRTHMKEHTSWKKMKNILPCMDEIASVIAAIVNYGRVLWLQNAGYKAYTVQYVPRCVTPKNCAIVAVRQC
ncbi:uncharacterized protein TM35_000431410 [Trypanosoma theileri]|uniref:tRNA:m(4)X modification enzyme TRM13 n=1 Tax=Trypanosoma theileri TaxID=67003 RepID=A0A1X0NJE0_9TRYP|nr:uncharacterized protein TM35_000431410 [Trypanosoma theileri]ORC84573.1 hypothetical protein TM35_000431410 [Trypanosoma theileri]